MFATLAENFQAPVTPPTAPPVHPNAVPASNGQGNPSNSGTRYSRVDFPIFNGDDLKGWVYRCEQFFYVDGTSEDNKVKIAYINLEGRALHWHQAMLKTHLGRELPIWNDYVRALYLRFGHTLHVDPMAELARLKQIGSIQEFLNKLDKLLNQVDLSEEHCISCFLNG